mgnify:CR=1 FL=1
MLCALCSAVCRLRSAVCRLKVRAPILEISQLAELRFALCVVNTSAINAWRRASLESAHGQLKLAQPRGKADRRRIAGASGAIVGQAHMHQAAEESTGGQHHGMGVKFKAELGHRANHVFAIQDKIVHRLLEQPKIGLILKTAANRLFV